MKLDIGSGGGTKFKPSPRGDINCDISVPSTKVQNFIRCDAHFLPFKQNIFERVFLYNVIEHLEAPFKALKEVYEVLIERGTLELATPNALHILKVVRAAKRGFYSPEEDHIATYGLPELKSLLEKVGFKQINVEYIYIYCNGFKYSLIERLILFLCRFKALRTRCLLAKCCK